MSNVILSQVFFIHLAGANGLTDFSISEQLATNGLNNKFPEFRLN